MTAQKKSREERAALILEQLEKHGPCLTELSLAVGQGVAKTPNFRSIIVELVENGEVVVQWAKGSNRQPTRFFSLPGQITMLTGFDAE
jgi:hypothetical protein